MSSLIPINLPITVQAKPKKLTLPDYTTLEKIVDLSKRLEDLSNELIRTKEELQKIKEEYKKKLEQDEIEITNFLQIKFKRQLLTKEIGRIRQAEQELNHTINRKIKEIISTSEEYNNPQITKKIQNKILENLAKKNNL
jgi:hypothetical protein